MHRYLFTLITFLLLATGSSFAQVRAVDPRVGSSGRFDYVSDRLYFGRSIPGGGEVSDSAWAAFLRDEVTPRFPNGLTVWRADGQWTDSTGQLVREKVMVVEILHPDESTADSLFGVIAGIYRIRFRQEAVLRAVEPARTYLYEGTQH